MSQSAQSNDRRVSRQLAEGLALVKAALRVRLATDAGTPQADWSAALDAVSLMEQACAPRAAEAQPWRGLTGAVGEPFVAMVGIDRFGGLREDLGEQDANAAVDFVCERIRGCADTVHLGRINRSSIEFTFFASGFAEAQEILVRLQQALEGPIWLEDRRINLDVAIGFAGRDAETDHIEILVDRAEHALASARANPAKIGAFTEQDRAARVERLSLMRDLRHAVANDGLMVFYQPKLNLRTASVTSMEALVRWPHAERGMVAPDLFIPLAEDAGEIASVTERVLQTAIANSDELAAAGHEVRIDINISGLLVACPDFAAYLLKTLEGREARFGFEVTETAVIANPERALSHIRAFSAAGIAIAIDDYGSGLSSLSYLKRIPAEELKIDKAFIGGLTSSHRDPLLVRSTIDLAHALDMAVTAEGVDDPMSLALLRAMGCDLVQGYLISQPLPFEAVAAFLDQFDGGAFAKPALRAMR